MTKGERTNMSDNPLDDDPAREERVRQRAYHLWEADGRPHGQDEEYWERASELVRMEGAGMPGQLPNPASLPGADPSLTEPVEEAFIQENLGEFPDRFADQGESQPTPKPKRDARAKADEDGPATGARGGTKLAAAAKSAPAKPAAAATAAAAAKPAAKPAAAAKAAPEPKPTPAAASGARKPKG